MTTTRLERLFPWLVLAVVAGWVGSQTLPPRPAGGAVDYAALGRVPVQDGGRVMPLDSLARTALQSISGRTEVQDENGAVVAPAVRWLAEVFDTPDWQAGPAAKYKVVRIEYDQLLAALDLPRRPGFYRYSVEEIGRNFPKLQAEIDKLDAKKAEGKPLDLYDAKIEDLSRKLAQYQRLTRADRVQPLPPAEPGGDWRPLRPVDEAAMKTIGEADFERLQKAAFERMRPELEKLEREYGSVERVPAAVAEGVRDRLRGLTNAELFREGQTRRGDVDPAAGAFTRVFQTARSGNGKAFAEALAVYRNEYLVPRVPERVRADAALEASFLGHFSPFYVAAELYLVVGVLSVVGWLVWHKPLNRAALYVGLFTLALHTVALAVRMYVHGRPPVTNLYSSAVFIGWGAVVLSLTLEVLYKNGIGNTVAAVAGAASMQVAHFLGGSGDTMAMLVAVLDTNFWLATHVTTVTLGYTATFVAGLIAIIYLVRGVFTTTLDRDAGKALASMMYGVLCFATLLSFVGTVLGGIWADYSWGRFWGWDPKENGAVMIVLWNCLILHARWGGVVKARGMAVLAVFGNVITAWSWFGTNQLQIGLHSYGFDNRLAAGCRWFWLSQLLVMGVGLVPLSWWRSDPTRAGKPAGPLADFASTAPAPVVVAPAPPANGPAAGDRGPRGKKGKRR